MTSSLKIAIDTFLASTGLEKGVAQNTALFIWSGIVGSVIAKNTSAESVEHGILVIRATTPAWRQELQFQKKEIIQKLNKKLGKHTIKDIRFI